MAENGILDYQGMNQAIYRGATSNIVVDTQSMSIEIGAGNSSHTSNLHIECDHDANVASIQLNSNVVTEFSRSKKLIKYPRVAMTADNQPTGYVASASTSHNSGNYNPYKAFNNTYESDTTSGWASDSSAFSNQAPSGSAASFNNDSGEYLTIQLPNKIKLETHHLFGRQDIRTNEFPVSAKLYASNDNFTSFELIESYEDLAQPSSSTEAQVHNINETRYFQYYRLMVTKTSGTQTYAAVGEWELYGVPEYDPEAHGTDVTVKSKTNVPNTDWLEVYYDAKGLATGDVTTVNDLKPSSLGSALNSSSTNNITVADDAFVFNGTDSYIKINDLTNPLGAWVHSVVAWVKFTDFDSSQEVSWIGDADGGSIRQSFSFQPGGETVTMGISGSNVYFRFTSPLSAGKWHHVVYTYNGGQAGSTSTAYQVFIDGVEASKFGGVGSGTLTLPADSALRIGTNYNGTNHFGGSIANFRLFNRALTSDEIYQLYAYQKEDFGHSTNNMTLKAGRLGIGTSEPRAALDVRGRIMREYNPGEIIETIQGKANGRYVKVQSGAYLLPNVGTHQDLTTTHTRIIGSNFDYTPPPGTTRVIYEFGCFNRGGDANPILHFQGRVDGTIVNDSRHTYRDNAETSGHDPQFWLSNYMCITIGEVTSDNIAGGQVATWTGSRTIDFTAREYSSGHEGRLHKSNHWNGTDSDVLIRPTIKITAIA